jgi:lipopolysaccharide export system protein LptC
MDGATDGYSRLVAWLKILLPVAALAILSTLFLLSRSIDPMNAIPFSQVDIDSLLRDPRITAPNYAGVTEDGTALSLTAETARPDSADPSRASALGLQATIETPDGVVTRITADQGAVDGGAGQVSLSGTVRFSNDLGYQVETEGIRFALDRTALETTGGIRATGPFGSLTAGGMVLRPSGQEGSYVLVFNGGVKLLYDPNG